MTEEKLLLQFFEQMIYEDIKQKYKDIQLRLSTPHIAVEILDKHTKLKKK